MQSESPSESELNALGLYLLVCLAFVIFALVEFAIAIILHRRKESNAVSDIATKSSNSEKKNKSKLLSQITKDSHEAKEWSSDASIRKTSGEENKQNNIWVGELGTKLSIVPSTNMIDFMAIWIYLAIFILFNCIYWGGY